jgi:phosphoglycolate phosphatase
MVGDREHDIIGAQGNAIDSIAVTYGYGLLLELQRANPTYFAHAVEDIGTLTG